MQQSTREIHCGVRGFNTHNLYWDKDSRHLDHHWDSNYFTKTNRAINNKHWHLVPNYCTSTITMIKASPKETLQTCIPHQNSGVQRKTCKWWEKRLRSSYIIITINSLPLLERTYGMGNCSDRWLLCLFWKHITKWGGISGIVLSVNPRDQGSNQSISTKTARKTDCLSVRLWIFIFS